MTFATREELASKVAWEGGIDEALRYGIRSGEMPPGDTELRDAWRDLELAFFTYEQAEDRVAELLPEEEDL